jgi:hypothetical protein
MGSLVCVELLDNPRYRKFLNRAFPWIRHVGIKHFFMTPYIAAAKDDRSGIVHFSTHSEEAAWTSNICWRNVDSLMIKLSKLMVSLLHFAKPEMLIQDYEWAGAYIKDGQFIGQLVVTPSFYLPCAQQDFDQLVRVQLKPHSENGLPSLKQILTMKLRTKVLTKMRTMVRTRRPRASSSAALRERKDQTRAMISLRATN